MQGPSSPQISSPLDAGRPLTQPSNPVNNNGRDNEHNDLIVCVQDILFNELSNNSYVVIDNLGKGTFGQVVRCWCPKTGSYVAVKIIKNQSAYYTQALIEVKILQSLNRSYDVDQHNIVRLLDCFPFRGHLCLVFELLQINLFELVKAKNYSGLTINLVQLFIRQVLHTLTTLRQEHVIHGDLKPENILLKDSSGHVKVIDFGSACMEHETIYSYIQSRFYRSPEVVLYYPYDGAIDMWSLGCIAAELALGLPLFTADSERDLLARMIEVLGHPPLRMLDECRRLGRYFKRLENGSLPSNQQVVIGGIYQLLDEKEFEDRNGEKAPTGKKYFGKLNLSEIMCRIGVLLDPRTNRRDHNPLCFLDFLHGVLKMDPKDRWNAHQASGHPFVTGQTFEGPYRPQPSLDSRPKSRPVGIGHQSDRMYSSTWHAQGLDPHSIAHEAALMAVSQLPGSVASNSPHFTGHAPLSGAGSMPRCGFSPDVTAIGRSMGSSFRGSMYLSNPILQAAWNAAKVVASTPTRSLQRQPQSSNQVSRIVDNSVPKDTMIVGFDVRKPDPSSKEPLVQQSPPSVSNAGGWDVKDTNKVPVSDNEKDFTFQSRCDYSEGNFSSGLFETQPNYRSNQNFPMTNGQSSLSNHLMQRTGGLSMNSGSLSDAFGAGRIQSTVDCVSGSQPFSRDPARGIVSSEARHPWTSETPRMNQNQKPGRITDRMVKEEEEKEELSKRLSKLRLNPSNGP